MDPFEMAEQALRAQGQQALALGPGTHELGGDVSVTNADPSVPTQVQQLPDGPPQPDADQLIAPAAAAAAAAPPDPFKVAEARLRTQTLMQQPGAELNGALHDEAALGVRDDFTGVDKAYNDYQQAAVPRTTIGGSRSERPDVAAPSSVDYPTWLKLRTRFQVQYPSQPLPPDLQVFDFTGEHTLPDGSRASMQQLGDFAATNTDRPLLHDEGLQQQARANFHGKGALPEAIQGTAEQRAAAATKAAVQSARVKYGPSTDRMRDDEVLTFDLKQQEQQARRMLVGMARKVLSDNGGSAHPEVTDEQLVSLVKSHPEAFQKAIADAAHPREVDAAVARLEKRKLFGGALADDNHQVNAESDAAIVHGEARAIAGRRASTRAFGFMPTFGELEHWANGWSFGIMGRLSKALGTEHATILDGYQQSHPYSAQLAELVGMFSQPGKLAEGASIPLRIANMLARGPGGAIAKGIGAVAGEPITAAVRGSMPGIESAGGRLARETVARAAGGAADMPLFSATSSAIAGDYRGAAQHLNPGSSEFWKSAGQGAGLSAAFTLAVGLVGGRASRTIANTEVWKGLSPEQQASIQRVQKMYDLHVNEGVPRDEALGRSKVTPDDLALAFRLRQQFRKRVAANVIESTSPGAELQEPEVLKPAAAGAAVAEAPPAEASPGQSDSTPVDQPPRPGSPGSGSELAPPQIAQLNRYKALIDQVAPRGADGTRKFEMPFFDQALSKSSALRRTIDQLTNDTLPTDSPIVQQRRDLLRRAKAIDELHAAESKRRGLMGHDEHGPLAPPTGPANGPEGRPVPPEPKNLGAPQWKPRLTSMAAAKSGAQSRGIVTDGVKLSATRQIATNQIVDAGTPSETATVAHYTKLLERGENSQADAVPPIVVRKLSSGGYQVLAGAEQLAAAKSHGYRQVPIIEAVGAAAPPARAPKPSDGGDVGGWPRELADAAAVGKWYAGQFKDELGAAAIEGLTSVHKGKYVLRDVPVEQIDGNSLMPGDVDTAKVTKFKAGEAKTAPPVIAVPGAAEGKAFSIADGAHRLAAAVARGDKTIRAYVPDTIAPPPAAAKPSTPSAAPPAAPVGPVHAPSIVEASMRDLKRAARHFDLNPNAPRHELQEQLRQLEEKHRAEGSIEPEQSLLDVVPAQRVLPAGVKGTAPAELATARHVAEWAAQHDPDVKNDVSEGAVTADYFEGELKKLAGADVGPFVKADVPLDIVSETDSYQPDVVQEYADLKTTPPPGVGGMNDRGDFVLVDGNTRARAARARGDKTVQVYVPELAIGEKGIKLAAAAPQAAAEEWDFSESFPSPVLDPFVPAEADGLQRQGIEWDDNGHFDLEQIYAIHEELFNELATLAGNDDAIGEALAEGKHPTTGKPLNDKQVKALKDELRANRAQFGAQLDNYETVFGAKAREAFEKHVRDAVATPPEQTPADKVREALYGALHHTSGAEARWTKLQESGATDEELRAAIAKEFGIAGGRPGAEFKGGKNPIITFDGSTGSMSRPELKGKALIDAVREMLHIPQPQAPADPPPGQTPKVKNPQLAAALRKLADALQKSIDHNFNPGTAGQNPTPRRARIIEGMRMEGERLERIQHVLRALADMHEEGDVEPAVAGIRTRTQVEKVLGWHGKYPSYTIHRTQLQDASKYLKGTKGGNSIGQWLWGIATSAKVEQDNFLNVDTTKGAAEKIAKALELLRKIPQARYEVQRFEEAGKDRRTLNAAGIDSAEASAAAYKVLRGLADAKKDPKARQQQAIAKLEREALFAKYPGFFPTPPDVADRLVTLAQIGPSDTVLEPSAGTGAIADAVRRFHPGNALTVIERQHKLREILALKGYALADVHDFTELPEGQTFDVIVMNPPFEKGQDMEHVQRAYAHLKPGGRVVAIVGEGAFFRSDAKATAWREWMHEHADDEEGDKLPPGTFDKSGTGVASRIIVLRKPVSIDVALEDPKPVLPTPGPTLPPPPEGPTTVDPDFIRAERELVRNGATTLGTLRVRIVPKSTVHGFELEVTRAGDKSFEGDFPTVDQAQQAGLKLLAAERDKKAATPPAPPPPRPSFKRGQWVKYLYAAAADPQHAEVMIPDLAPVQPGWMRVRWGGNLVDRPAEDFEPLPEAPTAKKRTGHGIFLDYFEGKIKTDKPLWEMSWSELKGLGFSARRSGGVWNLFGPADEDLGMAPTSPERPVGSESKALEVLREMIEFRARESGHYKPPQPLRSVKGKGLSIETAAGEKIPARWAIVEADDLIPSHDAQSFRPHPLYPAGVQERDYQHSKDEQAKVHRQVSEFNPDFVLTDNPDPVNGGPMVLSNGRVMGGNSRAMTIQQIYGSRALNGPRAVSLRALVIDRAPFFGISSDDVAAFTKPVLVRMLTEETSDPKRMRELVRLLQKGRTQEMSGAMDAAARARILSDSPTTLERLESILGDADSVREVLSTPSKVAAIRNWLVGSQVLTSQEYARYFNGDTGLLDEDGKRLIERILQAVVVPKVDLFDSMPLATANKVTGNLYALVYPKVKGPEWDLGPALTDALLGYWRWVAAEKPPIEAFLKGEGADGQQMMVPDALTAPVMKRAATILRRLITDNAVGWRERVQAYLDWARGFEKGAQTFDFAADSNPTPERAFAAAFESDAPHDAAGKVVTLGRIDKRGGGLFGSGISPEAHLHNLDQLRELLSFPETMTPALRGALRMPKRIREGGQVFMASGGSKPIDVAELLRDPSVAEKLARIATFHLEQAAPSGDKMLGTWAAGVRSDVGAILRDLGYAVEDASFDTLLERLWADLSADEDVKGALGELPGFDKRKISRGRRGSTGLGGSGGSGGAAGGSSQPGGGVGGGPELPPGEGPAGPGVVPGGSGAIPDEPAGSSDVPVWVGPGQRDDYFAALNSDRVSPYVPLAPTRSGHFHPRLLVESKALAGVPRADLAGYELDTRAAEDLSDPQRDRAAEIGYRIHVANAGSLTAHDVGVGKSRIIGGVIADQLWRRVSGLAGKGRVLLLTKNRQNIDDLIKTFTQEMATTFDPLRSETGLQFTNALEWTPEGMAAPSFNMPPRVLIGDAFNLVKYAEAYQRFAPELVIIDEAHLYSNLSGGTERANTLEQLHAHLQPGGTHFAYFTATPASDVAALQFMYGLGLWHPASVVEADKGGDLVTFDQWLAKATGVSKAGSWRESIATPIIEQLMRELKMDGAYSSLDFWRGGFEFTMKEASVTPDQLAMYDTAAGILNDAIRAYVEYRPQVNHPKWPNKEGRLSAPPRPDGQAIFFIKRMLVEFRLPAAIEEAKAALARGEQVVFKILGVNDTHLSGESGNLGAALDAIPTVRAQKSKNGTIERWVEIPGAKERVESLRARARAMQKSGKIESPLAQIYREFGEQNVAAIVGDTPARDRIGQNAEFQSGKRRVAVISPAGTTGINLQDLGTGRRFMVVLDLDWDSKEFKQSLGRVDRANQTTAPAALTIYTPIAGERKFQATIATRLRSLGALAKGQEDAGAEQEALNDFDMESSTWHRAINETVRSLPQSTQDQLLHAAKLETDELSWRDFQNDLMLLPHKLGNQIYDQAFARWKELEDLEQASTGRRVARRNRGMIRESTELDDSDRTPLAIHTVESIDGTVYGILSGKLLTRPASEVTLPTITDAIYGKGGSQTLRNHYVTMQQGERVVSGLYVPRAKINAVKALFGKAPQRELFGGREPGEGPPTLPATIINQLPPMLQLHATVPNVPIMVLTKKHRPAPLLSRQDITDFVIERLQLAVAKGKQARFRPRGGSRVLGYYWFSLVRQHVANEIAVLAHEVGHALDDILTGLKPPATFDHELMPLGRATSRGSYTRMQVRKEGVAEFFRRFMYDPAGAVSLAPTYAAWWESEMLSKHPTVWAAVQDLQQMYAQYLAQDPVAKLESQIDWRDDGPTKRSPIGESKLDYLYRHIFDDRRPLDTLRKELGGNGDGPLPDKMSQDAYTLSRLLPGNRSMVMGWVKYGVRLPNGHQVAKGIEPVLRENGIIGQRKLRQFEAYLVARRALELYQQADMGARKLANVIDSEGEQLGVSRQQARETFKRYDSPAFEAAAGGIYQWNDGVMRYLQTTGMFSPSALAMIQALNTQYVRFDRVLDEQAMGAGGSRSLVDKGRQFHQIRGSGRRIRRPLAATIRNTVRIVEAAEANKAALRAFEMIRKGGDYRWADKISRPLTATTATLEEIKKSLIAAGVDPDDMKPDPVTKAPPKIDLTTAFTIFRPTRHNPSDMEVALRIGGKIHVWQVHVPALYDAITLEAQRPTSNLLLRLLMAGRTLMRAGFTMPLDFVSGNVQRDQFTAMLQSRYGYVPTDFWMGLYHSLFSTETYKLWLQSRGSSSTHVSTYRDALQRTVDDMAKSKLRRAAEATLLPHRWIDLLFEISSATEEATRLGEFARALKAEGVNEEGLARAGMASRDVTVDFWRGGEWVRQLGQYRAFLGAAMQGPDYLARHAAGRGGTADSKTKGALNFIVKALASVTLLSVVLHYLSRENPDYQERRRERDLYWLIPIGDPKTTRRWFRLRKPHELGLVFGSAAESIVEYLHTHDKEELRRWFPDDGRGALDLLIALMPTAVVPLLEVGFNYDTFRDRPVIPEDLQHLEPALQYTRYTSETAKAIGGVTRTAPVIIDHLIYGYTGTAGRSGTQLLDDLLIARLRGTEKGELPSQGAAQHVPGLRVFFGKDLEPSAAESLRLFYARYDRLQTVLASLKAYAATDPAGAEKYRLANLDTLRQKQALEDGAAGLRKLREATQVIFDDRKMSADDKRARLRFYMERMIDVARAVEGKKPYTAPSTQRSP